MFYSKESFSCLIIKEWNLDIFCTKTATKEITRTNPMLPELKVMIARWNMKTEISVCGLWIRAFIKLLNIYSYRSSIGLSSLFKTYLRIFSCMSQYSDIAFIGTRRLMRSQPAGWAKRRLPMYKYRGMQKT